MKYTHEQKEQRKEETLRAVRLIRLYMHKNRKKVQDVAAILGCTPNTVSKWSNGAAIMSDMMVRLVFQKLEPEIGEISSADVKLAKMVTALAQYPTVDCRGAVRSLQQHILPPARYAERNSLFTSYFTDGEPGVDFGLKAAGMKIQCSEYKENTVFMVRANDVIQEGRLVLVVFREPESILLCKVRIGFEELVFLDPRTEEPVERASTFSDKVLGILLIQKIYQDERNISADLGTGHADAIV